VTVRVLLTGGAGYIGSHLVDALCDEGHSVRVLDDLSTGKASNLAGRFDEIHFVNGSVLDAPLVDSEVEQSELVIHLAATVGVRHIVADPLAAILTNTRGTTTVHRWSYSTAKAIDEHLALAYAAHQLPVVVVRYFNSYGPRLDERGYGSVVANLLRQALAGEPMTVHGDGKQSRCFTYIDDTVRGTLLAAFTAEAEGLVFNLGSTRETTIQELAELIRHTVGSRSEIRFAPYEDYYGPGFEDTRRRVPDITRARELLDWEPRVELADGLVRTIEWWQKANG
jgi:UDP-glucose 4-epimerase